VRTFAPSVFVSRGQHLLRLSEETHRLLSLIFYNLFSHRYNSSTSKENDILGACADPLRVHTLVSNFPLSRNLPLWHLCLGSLYAPYHFIANAPSLIPKQLPRKRGNQFARDLVPHRTRSRVTPAHPVRRRGTAARPWPHSLDSVLIANLSFSKRKATVG